MWILILILFVVAVASSIRIIPKDEAGTVKSSNSVAKMKRERLRLNPKYASSIKCKYCEHFNASGFCHVYPGGTRPDDACERFTLPLVEYMGHAVEAAEGLEFTRRPDGTYIVDLHDASK